MIKSLYEYGMRKGLNLEKGIANGVIDAHILLTSNGTFSGIEKHEKGNNTFPRANFRGTSGSWTHIVFEKRFIVLDEEPPIKDGKIPEKHKKSGMTTDEEKKVDYLKRMRMMSEADVPLVDKCLKAISDEKTRDAIRKSCDEQGITDSQIISFCVDGVYVEGSEGVISWWNRVSNITNKSDKDENLGGKTYQGMFLDMLTGNVLEQIPTAYKTDVKGLTSIDAKSPCSLVNNNLKSGEAYGRKGAACSPLNPHMYQTAIEALNYIIANNSITLGSVMLVYWYDGDVPDEYDVMQDVCGTFPKKNKQAEGASEEKGTPSSEANIKKSVLSKIREGGYANSDKVIYHIVLLRAMQSRVRVVEHLVGTFKELCDHINLWENDLSLTYPTGKGWLASKKHIDTRELVLLSSASRRQEVLNMRPYAGARQSALKELRGFENDILSAIVESRRISNDIGARATQALATAFNVGDVFLDNPTPTGWATNLKINTILMQWVKAWLIRELRAKNKTEESEQIMPNLNTNIENYAYHLGRILAVGQRIQLAAVGEKGKDITQTYFSMFMQSPATAFGSMQTLTTAHLAKLGKENSYLASHLGKKLADIATHVDTFPKTMSAEDKSYFALGYWHQYAWEMEQIEERKAQKTKKAAETEATSTTEDEASTADE